ncbi:antichymotrypsin-2-like [Zophobas morio]|uniref:antichymotrypsin-2-like n=1 Tax=Zophobas morio TaxID=2755281 RepID=UPI003082CDE3
MSHYENPHLNISTTELSLIKRITILRNRFEDLLSGLGKLLIATLYFWYIAQHCHHRYKQNLVKSWLLTALMASSQDFTKEILEGNAAFANKIYQILSRTPGNVFFSPFSLHIVIAMAYQGSGNVTLETIQKVLQIPDPLSTAIGYQEITRNLTRLKKVVLHTAFKIYLRKEFRLLSSFENTVKEYFDSEVESLDFDQRSATVKHINQWVSEKTHGKIEDIVDDDLIASTSLLLLNAIYFKGNWDIPFSERKTKVRNFYLNDHDVVKVQMMEGRKDGFYKYNKRLKSQILALPYEGEQIYMMIFLPEDKNGIGELEALLSETNDIQTFNELNFLVVDVSLPKFKFETTMEMDDLIKEIGLEVIYDPVKADLKGMIELEEGKNLCVTKILQKACIDVNEKGSEAAAASVVGTIVQVSSKGRTIKPLKFVVDHPAVFMIVAGLFEKPNVLFYGRLSHPEEVTNSGILSDFANFMRNPLI